MEGFRLLNHGEEIKNGDKMFKNVFTQCFDLIDIDADHIGYPAISTIPVFRKITEWEDEKN